tara:strand:- start:1071 stop:1370 length:300 start_codon:yes stop_codon:yes gene_type:complete
MKLLTKDIEKKLVKQLGTHEEDPVLQVKFFVDNWTWYAYEYDPQTRTFFGLVDGLELEMGYFSLDELESVTGQFGTKVERDQYFTPEPVSQVWNWHKDF